MNRKKIYPLLIIVCLVSLLPFVSGSAIYIFGVGESFVISDAYRSTSYTFTVTEGTMNAEGTLTIDSSLGTFILVPTADSKIKITDYNPGTTVYVDGAVYTSGNNITLATGATVTITWKSVTTIVVGEGTISDFYFRSDSYTTLGVTAYGLDEDYTNVYTSVNSTATGAVTFQYGFRAWLVESDSESTELTDGSPVGVITLAANDTGLQSATWDFAGSDVTLGYEALEVIIYEKQGSGAWASKASFISDVLLTDYIQPSTWTFYLWVDYTVITDTESNFVWGTSAYRSGIYNFIYTPPLESELQWWRLANADLIGFILGGYVDVIGQAFYVLLLFALGASMYRRYGHFGPVVFTFVLLGGINGIIWLLVPDWAALVVGAFVIVGGTFILWRLIR